MTTVDDLATELETFKSQVPTLEEQLYTVGYCCWPAGSVLAQTRTTGFRMTLLAAPIPLRVLSVALSFEYWNQSASDSSYWTAELEVGSGPTGFPNVAVRSTQNTGGTANGPVVARKPWTFDAAAWGTADMAAGQILTLNWSPTGSPTAFTFPMIATVRYAAL